MILKASQGMKLGGFHRDSVNVDDRPDTVLISDERNHFNEGNDRRRRRLKE